MLFRYWDDPLALEPLDSPSIELKDMQVPPGLIGYVKEYDGTVSIYGEGTMTAPPLIGNLAERNEVGIYNPSYFPPGVYQVTYTYLLHPPLEYDALDAHLNLRLVDDQHIPFRRLSIMVPSGMVTKVYPHPPSLSVREGGDTVSISGSLPANEPMGIEMLLSKDALDSIPGFPVFTPDVAGKTADANPWYDILPFSIAKLLLYLGFAVALVTPLLLLFTYFRYGKEREFTVPEYLSTIPNPSMKPWEVNLLFKGDATAFDEDGYYATLLDLHRKKVVTITEEEGGANVRIHLNRNESADPYEQRVLSFLGEIATDGVVNSADLEILASKAKIDLTSERVMMKYQQELHVVSRKSDPALIAKYIVDGREHIFPLLFAGIAFCAISFIMIILAGTISSLLIPAVILFGSVIVQSGVALAFPLDTVRPLEGGYLQGETRVGCVCEISLRPCYDPEILPFRYIDVG